MSSAIPAQPIDWPAVRGEFPALSRCTYLNTATFGQMPRRAAEAMMQHQARRDENAAVDFLSWFDDADRLRAKAARLVNARPQDIAFIPNASHALSLLFTNLAWEEGDEIIALQGEFPNQLYYPSLFADHGVVFREVTWEELPRAINRRTALVLLSTVNYMTGFRPQLEQLAAELRKRNIIFYVDGTQSVGALYFDCAAIQPDILAVHGYKWLNAPPGAGFLYVRPDFQQQLQPHVIGWRSDKNWRNVDALRHGSPEFPDGAEKYEGAMLAFPLLYALEACIDLQLEFGPQVIEQRVLGLAGQLRTVLQRHGAELWDGPLYASPILAAKFPGRDAVAIAKALQEQKVMVSARHGRLRVSVHFYNNEADLARLDEALGALR